MFAKTGWSQSFVLLSKLFLLLVVLSSHLLWSAINFRSLKFQIRYIVISFGRSHESNKFVCTKMRYVKSWILGKKIPFNIYVDQKFFYYKILISCKNKAFFSNYYHKNPSLWKCMKIPQIKKVICKLLQSTIIIFEYELISCRLRLKAKHKKKQQKKTLSLQQKIFVIINIFLLALVNWQAFF